MGEWIRCSDRMPDVDTRVLASDGEVVGEFYYSSNKYGKKKIPRWEWNGRVSFPWTLTHWQPLPAPPKDFS